MWVGDSEEPKCIEFSQASKRTPRIRAVAYGPCTVHHLMYSYMLISPFVREDWKRTASSEREQAQSDALEHKEKFARKMNQRIFTSF